MQKTLKMTVDVNKPGYYSHEVNQNDSLKLDINVVENGVAKDLTLETVQLNYLNANNTIASIAGGLITTTGNNIIINCPDDCTRSAGVANFQIVISKDGLQISTFEIGIQVKQGVINSQLPSDNIATIVEELVEANNIALTTKAQLEVDIANGNTTLMRTDLNTVMSDLEEKASQVEVNTISESLKNSAIQNICLIPETLKKLQNLQNVLIDIVGDSITYGKGATDSNCYVAIFANLMASLYPNSTVIRYDGVCAEGFEDAPITTYTPVTIQTGTNGQTIRIRRNGVGGDTVLMLGRRIDNFTTPIDGKSTDLTIICVGINDSLVNEDERYVPPIRFKGQLDGLVRNIKLRTNSEVALMTPPSTYTPALSNYAKAVQEVAMMNNLQCIEAYDLWINHYVEGALHSGQGDWGYDIWHASVLGQSKIGTLSFETLFKYNQKIASLNNTTKIYKYTNSMFTYSSGWTDLTIDNLSDGKNVYTEKLGSVGKTITFKVYASEIAILTRPSRGSGIISCSIDGGSAFNIDLNTTYPTSVANVTDANSASMSNEKVVIATNLDSTLHTVVLTVNSLWFPFTGIEIVDNNIATKNEFPPIINTGTIDVTGTGTAYKQINITFNKKHNTDANCLGIPNDINYNVSSGTNTNSTGILYLSRKDGATFTTTVKVTYISVDG